MMRSGSIRISDMNIQYFFDYEMDTSKTITDSVAIKNYESKTTDTKWARKFPLITTDIERHTINGASISLPAMNKSINLDEYLRVVASRTVFSALFGYVFYGVPGENVYLKADWINIMFPIKKKMGIIMYQIVRTYVSDVLRNAPARSYKPEEFSEVIRKITTLLESNGIRGVPGVNIVKDINSANPLEQGIKWIPLRDVYDILDSYMTNVRVSTEDGTKEITNYGEYINFVRSEWLSIENKMQKTTYNEIGPHVWRKLPIQAGDRLVVFDEIIDTSGIALAIAAKEEYAIAQRDLYRQFVLYQTTLNNIYELKKRILELGMDPTPIVNASTQLLGIVTETTNIVSTKRKEALIVITNIQFTSYGARDIAETRINRLIRIPTGIRLASSHVILTGTAAYVTSSVRVASNGASTIGADDFDDIDTKAIATDKYVSVSRKNQDISRADALAAVSEDALADADMFDGVDGDIMADMFDGADTSAAPGDALVDTLADADMFDGVDGTIDF